MSPPTEIPVVVESIVAEAAGVVSLVLVRRDGSPLPEWTPGAHVDLVLGPGLIRQYSLCGDPADRSQWSVAVLREPASRGGSAFVHDRLRPGDELRASAPRNHFALVEAGRYVLIAGGIGITPILPMIAALDARGAAWELLYGGRERTSMAFLDRLSTYNGQVTVWPQDEHGLLDLDALLGAPQPGTAVYCCGPGPLLDAVEERCERWPAGALHVERFRADPEALAGPRSSFEIVVDSTGERFTVGADESIVDVLASAGYDIPTSCLEGTCGTCETGVLAGIPDHRDSFLTAEDRAANDVMTICCSRAKSAELILDL